MDIRKLPPLVMHALAHKVVHGLCGELFPWGVEHTCQVRENSAKYRRSQ